MEGVVINYNPAIQFEMAVNLQISDYMGDFPNANLDMRTKTP